MKSREEVTGVEIERFLRPRVVDQPLELDRIAAERTLPDPELVAFDGEDVFAQQPPEVMEALPKGATPFFVTELGPEQRE